MKRSIATLTISTLILAIGAPSALAGRAGDGYTGRHTHKTWVGGVGLVVWQIGMSFYAYKACGSSTTSVKTTAAYSTTNLRNGAAMNFFASGHTTSGRWDLVRTIETIRTRYPWPGYPVGYNSRRVGYVRTPGGIYVDKGGLKSWITNFFFLSGTDNVTLRQSRRC